MVNMRIELSCDHVQESSRALQRVEFILAGWPANAWVVRATASLIARFPMYW